MPGPSLGPEVTAVLARLHADADRDKWRFLRKAPAMAAAVLGGRREAIFGSAFMKDVYIAVSPAQGQLLYLVARALGARRIVEFGTSFGISTLYLAAAVRDNGGGSVIGSEVEAAEHPGAAGPPAAGGLR